jgi:hypothetical protein
MFAGVALCLGCGGKSAEPGTNAAQGGSTGGNIANETGGTLATTGGLSSSGGQGPGIANPPGPCLVGTFPGAGPDGAAAALCPDATLYCSFDDRECGRGGPPGGVCASREACAADDVGPICGCDGVVYEDACAARAAGVDVDTNGACQLEGSFFCAGLACKLNTEACVANQNHIDGTIIPHCVPLTAECLTALVSLEDKFCECVRPGRCSCQVQSLGGGTGIVKLCGDR